ncbi:hypothetical protein CR983_03865 [Candidatus Saccharibacteria bacterium]|nr:MAG: hypothetical protein CR983_03865 [Candidatus Saccharibacteria bacterium]
MKRVYGWKLIYALVLAYLFFVLLVIPMYQAELNQIAGTEVRSLDSRFWYDRDDAMSLFRALHEPGRAKLQSFSGVADMVYPLVYGSLCVLLLCKLIGDLSLRRRWVRALCVLPVAAAVFDYIENISIVLMLGTFPNVLDVQVMVSALATSLKWLCLGAVLFMAAVVAVIKLLGMGDAVLSRASADAVERSKHDN